ncbi:DUF3991 domain-containing protein [Lactobacillus xujianguonis]|uniref:DUF3991 domain-containing protein n=2 Tax=Lactobacillaceae TaxID=33958 RepID=A0A437SWK4_9LACO|nr:DUF3991 domain-containing protein [Lactobacillus xujianguonis]
MEQVKQGRPLDDKYRFSTLPNFNKELGLEKERVKDQQRHKATQNHDGKNGRAFTSEQIKAANQASIVEYANVAGIELEQTGADEFKGVEHDSLVITPSKNSFYWNSRQVHGKGALSFVEQYEMADSNLNNKDKFIFATKKVLESGVSAGQTYQVKKEPFKFNKDQLDKDNKINRVWGYLHNERGISSQTIDQLHNSKVLFQDKYGNALFLWRDPKTKEIKGTSKQGTKVDHQKYGKRGTLKVIEKNSTTGYGFTFDSSNMNGKTPENIKFFESPIDAISFYDLSKAKIKGGLKNTRFVSMDGLKKEVFNSYIKQTSEQLQKEGRTLKTVALGVDNDEAGKKFVKDIQSKFSKVKYIKPSEKFGKDWNDTLKVYRKIESKEKDKTPEKKPVCKPAVDPKIAEMMKHRKDRGLER